MKKISRHTDYIYESEDYVNNPKEKVVFLAKLISSNSFNNPSILDIGCANGGFLNYIKNNLKFLDCYGVDYSKSLIDQAKKLDGIHFLHDNAETFIIDKQFDVISMQGVLGYFDDIYPALSNIKKHLKPSGKFYIDCFFNDYDIDVQIKYRNNRYFNSFEKGWNNHSIFTIKSVLKNIGLKIDYIHEFDLSFELEKKEDPGRAWHINTDLGRFFINGLGLIYQNRVLEISHIE